VQPEPFAPEEEPDKPVGSRSPENNPPADHGRFHIAIKPYRTATGMDVAIHLHFPPLVLINLDRLRDIKKMRSIRATMPRADIPDPALLLISIFLAIIAQVLIHKQVIPLGLLAYLVCANGLLLWRIQNKGWKDFFAYQVNISIRLEAILIIIFTIFLIFSRFYDLSERLYILESDESKWIAQSWYSVILGTDYGEFHELHYKFLPVDFWMRSVFLRFFGVNFVNARIESAVISIISTIFLYLLVRRLFKSPALSLLSVALYGFSYVELTASHQSLHHSPVALWMISGLYFLWTAAQKNSCGASRLQELLWLLGC